MNFAVLLQPEVAQALPDLAGELRSERAETAGPSYRSEAFAEDLHESHAVPAEAPRRRRIRVFTGLLMATPVGLAVVGAVLAMLAQAH